jgi:hypothetical protein
MRERVVPGARRLARVIYRLTPLLVLVAVCSVSGRRASFREDELQCEEAVARLADCCPAFSAQAVSCVYVEGCGEVVPDLGVGESKCIRSLSCGEIRERGLCEYDGPDGGVTPVCP